MTTGGITYVVSGAGGNGFNMFQLGGTGLQRFRESSYSEFVKVTVSPTALVVDGIRADTNAVFDSVTIGQQTGDSTATDGTDRVDRRPTRLNQRAADMDRSHRQCRRHRIPGVPQRRDDTGPDGRPAPPTPTPG